MRIVLLGAPGAGKGTQCKRIVDRYGLLHLSSGDILRQERAEGTELGRVPCHAWSADGKYIYFNMRESQPDPDATTADPISSGKFELCRIPVTGGEIEKLGLQINGLFLNMSMHPSGNRIAFSKEDQFLSEIWVMDNIF